MTQGCREHKRESLMLRPLFFEVSEVHKSGGFPDVYTNASLQHRKSSKGPTGGQNGILLASVG